MKEYSLPQPIWMSFYSRSMYRAIAQTWRARSAAYLFITLILCWTPGLVVMHKGMQRAFDTIRAVSLPQIPTLTIDKGELKTPENRPYVISFGEGLASAKIVIDTSGNVKTLEQAQAVVLVTRTQVLMRKSAAETRLYELSAIPHYVLDQTTLARVLTQIQRWLPWVVYPLIFLLSFVKRFIQAIITALIGLLLVHMLEARLDFAALLSLAIVSMTPMMVVTTLAGLSGTKIPLEGLLVSMVGFGYFLFAINAATDTTADDSDEA
jgi:hypothetical protein